MSEGISRIHNVFEFSPDRRRRKGSRSRPRRASVVTPRSGSVVSDIRHERRTRAGQALDRASSMERARGNLRDLAIRGVEQLLAESPSDSKPVGSGRHLRATRLLDSGLLTALTRERETSGENEVTSVFLAYGGEVYVLREEHLTPEMLGQWREPELAGLDINHFREANGAELMHLCDDLSRPGD